jgi:hypothetical protein
MILATFYKDKDKDEQPVLDLQWLKKMSECLCTFK